LAAFIVDLNFTCFSLVRDANYIKQPVTAKSEPFAQGRSLWFHAEDFGGLLFND